MTANRTAPFFARLLPASDEPDAELVRRFAASRDAMAFEILVRRHGPLVFGICRRTLGHTHDAEDAFQAAFLVLAQKASTIRDPDSLPAWLYGVAMRVAKKAKSRALSRREEARADVTELMVNEREHDWDTGRILDEELAALAEHYRIAILLCDVQELSRSEAATKLGIPEGTLSSRLAKGRKLLATRLKKRGVALSVPLMASIASASVPEKLVQHTLEMLNVWTVGGTVAKPITELARGGTTMFAKVMLLGATALAMTALGVGLANDPAKPEAKKPEVKAEVKAEKVEVVYGKPRLKKSEEVYASRIQHLGWTADGKYVWFQGIGITRVPEGGLTPVETRGVYFFLADALKQYHTRDVPFYGHKVQFLNVSADGKFVELLKGSTGKINAQQRLLRVTLTYLDKEGKELELPQTSVELIDKELRETAMVGAIPIEPEFGTILGFANAGKSFITLEDRNRENPLHRKMLRRSEKTGDVEETLLDTKNASMVYHSTDFTTLAWIVVEQREVALSPGAIPTGNPRPKENHATKVEVRPRGTPTTWCTKTRDKYEIANAKLTADGATLLVSYRTPRPTQRGGFAGTPKAEPKTNQPQGLLIGYDTITGREVFKFTNETHHFERMELSSDGKLIAVAGMDETLLPQQISQSLLVCETATGKVLKQWSISPRNREQTRGERLYQSVMWAFSPTTATLLIAEPGEKQDTTSLGLWEFPTTAKP